jgi:hypothetical protein
MSIVYHLPPVDYFVAKLECLFCHSWSPETIETGMSTYILDTSSDALIAVGSRLSLQAKRIADNDYDQYQVVNIPSNETLIRILQSWACPTCGHQDNWARITVRDGIVNEMISVQFCRTEFDQAHLLGSGARGVAAELKGVAINEIYPRDIVAILKNAKW